MNVPLLFIHFTGVGSLYCVLRLAAQWCLTLCDPMDCCPPGSSVHGDCPGNNIGVHCHDLLQETFPTQGSNPGLTVQADSLPSEPPGKSVGFLRCLQFSSCYIFGLVSWNKCKSHPNLSQTFSHKGYFRTHIMPHPSLKISNPWKMISHCDLTCISMITNESTHVFMYLFVIHVFFPFFCEMCIHISEPCFCWVVILVLNLLSQIIIPWWFSVLQMYFLFCILCFSLFQSINWWTEVLNPNLVKFITFFMICACCVLFKRFFTTLWLINIHIYVVL